MHPMTEDAVLVDSSVVLHALGGESPYRPPCRALLQDLLAGTGRAYASTEMIQEVVHHRMRRATRDQALTEVRTLMPMFVLLNVDHEVLELSLELIEHTHLRGRDAVHVATAKAYGIGAIASSDAGFDDVPGIHRIDPLARVRGASSPRGAGAAPADHARVAGCCSSVTQSR